MISPHQLTLLTKSMPLAGDVKLKELTLATQNYSGADLTALCREAAVNAMQNNSSKVGNANFVAGLKAVKPSITKEVDSWYDSIQNNISQAIPKSIDKAFYG